MIFSPRINQRELAGLCRRLSTASTSGIELRSVWAREAAGRSRATLRRYLQQISQQINRGTSLSEAVRGTGDFFPDLFQELVDIGEQSGQLPEVFGHLADHYEHQQRLRRMFLSSITWPMLQLTAAVVIVGLMILLMGWVSDFTGESIDILGLGLVGFKGLVIYSIVIGGIAAILALVYQAMRRGMLWTRPLQRLLLRLPGLGRPLQTLALARLAWTLHLTLGTALPLLRALPLCLRSTQNALYTDHIDAVVAEVRKGNPIYEALAATGAFPADFLESLEVGEQSGRLPETMALLSEQYQDQTKRAMAALTVVGGFLVWCIVAGLIILVIFRIFSWYVRMINEAANF